MRNASIAPGRMTRWIIGLGLGVIVALPLVSMLEFSLRDGDGYSLAHWSALFDPANARLYKPVWLGLTNSIILALVTVFIVLVVITPTIVLVNLRFRSARRWLEFLALLPISIPAIVVVVGLAPVYQLIGRTVGTGAWTLGFAYGIIVLPFAYRAIQASIDAIDLGTLSEAARTLGANWVTTLLHVIAPNVRTGLLSAALISVAVVLGEYTIASILGRQNLQTALVVISKQDPWAPVILSLLSLLVVFVLLLGIGVLARARSGRKSA